MVKLEIGLCEYWFGESCFTKGFGPDEGVRCGDFDVKNSRCERYDGVKIRFGKFLSAYIETELEVVV